MNISTAIRLATSTSTPTLVHTLHLAQLVVAQVQNVKLQGVLHLERKGRGKREEEEKERGREGAVADARARVCMCVCVCVSVCVCVCLCAFVS
jgi:hypothetical protein